MKKTYINPTMEVVKIATQQMLAASNPNVTLDKSGSVDADKVEGRFGIFDEDEE